MRLKKIGRNVVLTIGILVVLNVVYLMFMTLAFSLPADGKIKENIGASLYTWENEDIGQIFDDTKSFFLDLSSDMIWANIAATRTDNPLLTAIEMPYKQVAFDGEGVVEKMYRYLIQALYYPDSEETISTNYSRYWMLIAGILRILFVFWEIREIRYIFYFLTAGWMVLVLYKACKLLDWRGVLPLAVAMTVRVWLMHSASISLVPDILITLVSLYIMMCIYQKEKFQEYAPFLYLVIGSLSFATGPLVAPLLTLGMVLIMQVLLTGQQDSKLASWGRIIGNSMMWVLGYAGTIGAKSILAKLTIGEQTASETIMYWLGPGQGIGQRVERVRYCLEGLMAPIEVKGPMMAIIVIMLIFMMFRRGWQNFEGKLQLIFIALYPVVWSFIIVEHSIHYFVANIFSILVYSLLSVLVFMIRDKR